MIETVKMLKLAELTMLSIENVLTEKTDSTVSTGMGKLIAIEEAIKRYNFYKLYPEKIPPHVLELMG